MVSARDNNPAADAFHPLREAAQALGRLGPCAEFVVIQRVLLTDIFRRQIGHTHIGSRHNPQLAPARVDGSQRGGGRQQHVGQHQPEKPQQKQRQFQRPGRPAAERRVALGDKRADPHHFRFERTDKQHVFRQLRRRLAG